MTARTHNTSIKPREPQGVATVAGTPFDGGTRPSADLPGTLGPSRCAANIPARSPSLKLLSPEPGDPLAAGLSPATLSYVGKSLRLDSGMMPPPKNPRLAIS